MTTKELRMIDGVLRDEMAWHRTKAAAQTIAHAPSQRRAFIRGLRQARWLVKKIAHEFCSSTDTPVRKDGVKWEGEP